MRHFIILTYVWVLAKFRSLLLVSNVTTKLIYLSGFNNLRQFNAIAKAYAEFVKARRNVPAYRAFLKANGFTKLTFNGLNPSLHEIPITTKENYVQQYDLSTRCISGQITSKGVVIDESSGSSGSATNWARGARERELNGNMIRFGLQNLFGKGPHFIINAFALGSWATGMNVTMSCVNFAQIKSTGPDQTKIENTIRHFGSGNHYIVMGYPPFLKLLVDQVNLDWHAYNVSFIFGGEPMPEEMRDYLINRGIKRVYSSLGASDLELNLAAENDFTISLRRLLRSNLALRKQILKYTGALPMVFQYNPADFLIESTSEGELVFTVCRPGYLAPKIRYNLHDKGHVLQMDELYQILRLLQIDETLLAIPPTDLPLLFHYGRADMTVSFFGANVSPSDIQETIGRFPQLMQSISSFYLSTTENKIGQKQFLIALERHAKKSISISGGLATAFFNELSTINQDFKAARGMLANIDQLKLILYDHGTGPFQNKDLSVKVKYLAQKTP